MMLSSKTKRGVGPAFRNRTTACRTSELDRITPCPCSLTYETDDTRMRLCSLVRWQESALFTSLPMSASPGVTK